MLGIDVGSIPTTRTGRDPLKSRSPAATCVLASSLRAPGRGLERGFHVKLEHRLGFELAIVRDCRSRLFDGEQSQPQLGWHDSRRLAETTNADAGPAYRGENGALGWLP